MYFAAHRHHNVYSPKVMMIGVWFMTPGKTIRQPHLISFIIKNTLFIIASLYKLVMQEMYYYSITTVNLYDIYAAKYIIQDKTSYHSLLLLPHLR